MFVYDNKKSPNQEQLTEVADLCLGTVFFQALFFSQAVVIWMCVLKRFYILKTRYAPF